VANWLPGISLIAEFTDIKMTDKLFAKSKHGNCSGTEIVYSKEV
jgi:hypothetical protein